MALCSSSIHDWKLKMQKVCESEQGIVWCLHGYRLHLVPCRRRYWEGAVGPSKRLMTHLSCTSFNFFQNIVGTRGMKTKHVLLYQMQLTTQHRKKLYIFWRHTYVVEFWMNICIKPNQTYLNPNHSHSQPCHTYYIQSTLKKTQKPFQVSWSTLRRTAASEEDLTQTTWSQLHKTSNVAAELRFDEGCGDFMLA